jgi:hypothetical protein
VLIVKNLRRLFKCRKENKRAVLLVLLEIIRLATNLSSLYPRIPDISICVIEIAVGIFNHNLRYNAINFRCTGIHDDYKYVFSTIYALIVNFTASRRLEPFHSF